jgi:signal recognition particle subunit SRP54
MFENLQDKLDGLFRGLRGQARMTERNIEEALRDVRIALLDADVSYRAAKTFVKKVQERAVGQEVLKSLTPGQQVIKIVHEELVDLMGGKQPPAELPRGSRQVVMLMGLQGSGKTTTAAKLANYYKKEGRRPLLVAADIYRPAAVKQLEVLGGQIDIPVFSMGTEVSPVEIAKKALDYADKEILDTVILDTAGRLHIDDDMMTELEELKKAVNPYWRLFVADSMTGQDATQQAETFHEKVGIDGVILTKLDGDTRGGAAISIRYVTGRPILFAGIGEKLDNLEIFHPDRMASRILGMGDVLTLVEKAQAGYTEDERKKLQRKIRKAELNFNDFLEQMKQVKNMGGAKEMLAMLPGMGGSAALKDADIDEKEIDRTEAIIYSMTKDERERPAILNGSRRRRIAEGSGSAIQDVNQLLKSFDQAKKIMKKMGGSKFTPSKKDRKKKGKKGSRKNSLRSLFR